MLKNHETRKHFETEKRGSTTEWHTEVKKLLQIKNEKLEWNFAWLTKRGSQIVLKSCIFFIILLFFSQAFIS